MARPMLPLHDLAEHIVEYISTKEDLEACSLASRMFTPYCQRRLITSLRLIEGTRGNTAERLGGLKGIVSNNPRILAYFRTLELNFDDVRIGRGKHQSLMENADDLAFLERLTSIEEFIFSGGFRVKCCPPMFHDFMCKMLSLESLRKVECPWTGISGFPWLRQYLVCMPGIQELMFHLVELERTDLSSIDDMLSICDYPVLKRRRHLLTLHTGGSNPVVLDTLVALHDSPNSPFNLSYIEELQLDPASMKSIRALWNIMLRCSNSLRKVEWICDCSLEGNLINNPIDLGMLKNLLWIDFSATGDVGYPVETHLKHLRDILSSTSRCSLERLTITTSTGACTCWKNYVEVFGAEWRHFDEALSDTERFPELCLVELKMDILHVYEADPDNEGSRINVTDLGYNDWDIRYLQRCFRSLSSRRNVMLTMGSLWERGYPCW